MAFYNQGFKKKGKAPKPDVLLWEIFSIYTRLKDSNENGYVQCFTCKAFRYWRDGDAGHGVGRQHMATKYDDKNNHFQCKLCNGPGQGRQADYKVEMNKRYGAGTWDLMVIKSKTVCKWGKFEFETMRVHYLKQIKQLLPGKKLKPKDQKELEDLTSLV